VMCPNKEQVLDAARTSRQAQQVLEKLFPEYFQSQYIKPGEIYEWGEPGNQWTGLVVELPSGMLCLVNFINGKPWTKYLEPISKARLQEVLVELKVEGAEYALRGPRHWRSWCTK
jgi:hypothetical protein